MSKIFYLMGKSASGKDTIYKRIREAMPELQPVVIYTTRPIRAGETEGVEYHFTDEDGFEQWAISGKVIEARTYQTVHGPWTYFTADDGQFDGGHGRLAIGTLESYLQMRQYFGAEKVEPIYVEVEDGLRLSRALERERGQEHPKYQELCRRFLADSEDFSEEKLMEAEISRRYQNIDMEECLAEILLGIRDKM